MDDFRRDGRSWLIEGLENAGDASDLIAVRVAEFHHCHLDDFAFDGVKAGRLEIDVEKVRSQFLSLRRPCRKVQQFNLYRWKAFRKRPV